MRSVSALLLLAAVGVCRAETVTFDWALVGNAGNADDLVEGRAAGGVPYNYAIAKTEVTNAQYVRFLNAVASDDTNGLYDMRMTQGTRGGVTRQGGPGNYTYAVKAPAAGRGAGGGDYAYANKPVIHVSFLDAMRFANWLENGQPVGAQGPGTTEDGAYLISDGLSEVRDPGASFFLPSEDEWYKAAYHDAAAGASGVYFEYPTGTDVAPDNHLPGADSGNSANFFMGDYTTGDWEYPMTDVGAYRRTTGPYGTFDQAGNVFEWTEAIVGPTVNDLVGRQVRGGSWANSQNLIPKQWGIVDPADDSEWSIGFRVASVGVVPEPCGALLLAAVAIGRLTLHARSRSEGSARQSSSSAPPCTGG